MPDPRANTHKKLRNLAILKKELVNAEKDVKKNGVSIRESSQLIEEIHKVFWEKNLGLLVPDQWANTHEKSVNLGDSCKGL